MELESAQLQPRTCNSRGVACLQRGTSQKRGSTRVKGILAWGCASTARVQHIAIGHVAAVVAPEHLLREEHT